MFVFDRSAAAVLLPIALLIAVVLWSGRSVAPAAENTRAEAPSGTGTSTVAQAGKPHDQGG